MGNLRIKTELQTFIKLATIIIVILYITLGSMVIQLFYKFFDRIQHLIPDPAADIQEMRQRVERSMHDIEDHMIEGADRLNKIKFDTKAFDAAFDEIREELHVPFEQSYEYEKFRKRYYDFLESHKYTYDSEAYENDAQKIENIQHIFVPTFDTFVRLREQAYHCGIEKFNNQKLADYKNAIAKLNYEGKSAQTNRLVKPKVLSWPLTDSQKSEVERQYIFKFFESAIHINGRCKK